MNRRFRMFLLIASASLGFTVTACSADGQEPPATSSPESPQAEASQPEVTQEDATSGGTFADGVLETDELKIEITDVQKLAVGDPGNEYGDKPVLAFWYTITNKSDEVLPPFGWIMHFEAIQDNDPNIINELEVAGHPDSSLLDNSFADIKPGGSLPDATAYELDDETTPVELIASLDFGASELGTQVFQIP